MASASASEQKPFSGGKARSWVPRACDRCRKRKARCDETVPCKNCTDAGVICTHDAPVLKRGPRPRQQQTHDLESRLRNLEHLISSIPGGGTAGSTSLSSGELDQIRHAAHPTPGSDASPHESWIEAAGPSNLTAAAYAAMTSNPNPNPNPDTNGFTPRATPAGQGQGGTHTHQQANTAWMQGFGDVGAGIGTGTGTGTGIGMPPPAMGHSFGTFGGVGLPGPSGYETFAPAQSNTEQRHSVVGQTSRSTPAGPGQDLMYTDAEGQTKWLGPSSGMPLLDKLKTGVSSPPQPSGMSLAEEWISLSAAIGMDVDRQALPQPGPSSVPPRLSEAGHGPMEDDTLWLKLLEICPQDLVDVLVRAYFTISHLLWPVLHAPTFMEQYASPLHRRNPSFVALVLSVCCLSSRYAQDARLAQPHPGPGGTTTSTALRLLAFARETVSSLASERTDLETVQALFNMSVVQEGTARPSLLWFYLSQALSMAIELGLHRRADAYSSFSAVDIEVRKRTMWALYCQDVKASCTFDLDEPSAVDDVFISAEAGIGVQPPDRPSVMAGFVTALRLHMILERTIRRINQTSETLPDSSSFASLLLPLPRTYRIPDELDLLPRVTEGMPGDWTYTPGTVADPDSVRFFQKTRVFTLQHFIRLLVARHRFSELLERLGQDATASPDQWASAPAASPGAEGQSILQQITQSALGIIGTYCVIDARGRLGFFGAHAIAQLTQAGAGLIGVILHLRSSSTQGNEAIWHLAMQGLPAAIQILRQLGKRRPAGLRSAELLAEFSRACRIPVFTGPEAQTGLPGNDGSPGQPPRLVEVPMLRSLPRRESVSASAQPQPGTTDLQGSEFEEWLSLALSGSRDAWMAVSDAPQTTLFSQQ